MFRLIRNFISIVLLLVVVSVAWGRFFNPLITITQLDGLLTYGKLDRDYISYDDMGRQVKLAVVASEDQGFFEHQGFELEEIKRAMEANAAGKKLRGGSTISQQTAKNIFLWQGRTWLRKGLEAFFTFVIEKTWGKKIILERYLNSIEMGQGVFGVEAASHYYFKKSAKNLSKSEAAWIAAILPNPKKYDPNNPSAYLRKKHRWIMRQMNNISLPKE